MDNKKQDKNETISEQQILAKVRDLLIQYGLDIRLVTKEVLDMQIVSRHNTKGEELSIATNKFLQDLNELKKIENFELVGKKVWNIGDVQKDVITVIKNGNDKKGNSKKT